MEGRKNGQKDKRGGISEVVSEVVNAAKNLYDGGRHNNSGASISTH